MSVSRSVSRAVFLFAVLALGAVTARAETTQCTAITTVPYTIAAQGVYCLTGDLATSMTSGKAIEIQANNVVLDLNGHRLGGATAGLATAALGIYSFGRQNVVIRNGTVRGFYYGIFLDDAFPTATTGLVVEDMRIDECTFIGIQVNARGAIIRRNQISSTGGSTVGGVSGSAIAISVAGPESRILDNDVVTVLVGAAPGSTSWGIGLSGVGDAQGHLVVGNSIIEVERGIEFDGAGGKYRGNLTQSVTTPYIGGTDAGNNN